MQIKAKWNSAYYLQALTTQSQTIPKHSLLLSVTTSHYSNYFLNNSNSKLSSITNPINSDRDPVIQNSHKRIKYNSKTDPVCERYDETEMRNSL